MAIPNTGNVTGRPETRSVQVASDLIGKEYTLVKLDGANDNQVVAADDASAVPYVLTQGVDGSVNAQTVAIVIGGRTKVVLGGTVAQGDRLTSDANGAAVTTTAEDENYGLTAEAAGVAGDIIPVTVTPGNV